jgi:hypothetical protein
VDVLPAAEAPGLSRERVRDLAKTKLGAGKNKADAWLKLAIEDGIVERVQNPIPDSKRTEALFRRKETANTVA